MNLLFRRLVLGATSLLGAYVGIWATLFPQQFYASFPGFGLMWVAVDGPFNEHLIRDVGSLYLALAGAGVYAVFAGGTAATRAVGVAWTVFGLPHLGYHLGHLQGLAMLDAVGNVVSLGGSLLLGILLLLPERRQPTEQREVHA